MKGQFQSSMGELDIPAVFGSKKGMIPQPFRYHSIFRKLILTKLRMLSTSSGYADFLIKMSLKDKAISEMKRARELDPLYINWSVNLGYTLYFARQYSQAVEQLKTALEMDKNNLLAHTALGYSYTSTGQYNDAIAEYEEGLRIGGASTSTDCYLGLALAKAGRRGEAEAILKRLETTKEYVSPAELATLYIGLDQKEQALSALERAYAEHDVQMQFLGVAPFYDPLRTEPRFQELIRKVGLPS
jgi:tetratricopeptide (TPR) repeat protein